MSITPIVSNMNSAQGFEQQRSSANAQQYYALVKTLISQNHLREAQSYAFDNMISSIFRDLAIARLREAFLGSGQDLWDDAIKCTMAINDLPIKNRITTKHSKSEQEKIEFLQRLINAGYDPNELAKGFSFEWVNLEVNQDPSEVIKCLIYNGAKCEKFEHLNSFFPEILQVLADHQKKIKEQLIKEHTERMPLLMHTLENVPIDLLNIIHNYERPSTIDIVQKCRETETPSLFCEGWMKYHEQF